MTIPSLGALVPSPRGKAWPRPTRRGRERAAVAAGSVTLASAGISVPLSLVENDPMFSHLVVEDLCWRMAVEDLRKRRPRRGDRARQDAWSAEQAYLDAEGKRLAGIAAETVSAL